MLRRLRKLPSWRGLVTALAILATANVALFAVARWVFVPLHVPSGSMRPELEDGDRVLAARSFDVIERGDVVVLRSPAADGELIVKRVVALEGESIQARDGVIAIDNEQILQEPWLPASQRDRGTRAARSVDIPLTRLELDEIFVLGDNRARSTDSRSFGAVHTDRVVGRVVYRFWPPGRAGSVARG